MIVKLTTKRIQILSDMYKKTRFSDNFESDYYEFLLDKLNVNSIDTLPYMFTVYSPNGRLRHVSDLSHVPISIVSNINAVLRRWLDNLYVNGTIPSKYVSVSTVLYFTAHSIYLARTRSEKAGKRYQTCKCCGEILVDHEQVSDINGETYCEFCSKQYFRKCNVCNEYYDSQSMVAYSETFADYYEGKARFVCRECLHKIRLYMCDSCGASTTNADEVVLRTDRNGNDVNFCSQCAARSIFTCPICSQEVLSNDSMYDEERGMGVCYECYEKNTPILAYNYKPKFVFHNTHIEGKLRDDTLCMGFELEVERAKSNISRVGMADIIKDRYGLEHFYVAHDGSLENGIEIVSQPFTWSYFKNNVDLWDDLLLFIRSKGWSADSPRVGFHVHMSKSAFTSVHLYKFMEFIYEPAHTDFIKKIAGRNGNRYAQFNEHDYVKLPAVAKTKRNVSSGDHYHAVNLTSPHTVECRIFKGSLEPLIFYKNIEFLVALYKFTGQQSLKDISVEDFCDFIRLHRRKYPCLVEFLLNFEHKKKGKKKKKKRNEELTEIDRFIDDFNHSARYENHTVNENEWQRMVLTDDSGTYTIHIPERR